VPGTKETHMQGVTYLVAAYIIVWIGLFAYLAVIALRIRGVRTELAAVEELLREKSAKQDM
jgi:CcmD family protein